MPRLRWQRIRRAHGQGLLTLFGDRGNRRMRGRARAELTGQRFGMLQVVEFVGLDKGHRTLWRCLCDCGSTSVVDVGHLRSGHTTSCGCKNYFPRPFPWKPSRHGLTGTPAYNSWEQMLSRCFNPRNARWHRYGGRGITVCPRWMVFENFLEDMGVRPEGKSLERRNNNGNYEPSNCYWATPKQQQNNTCATVFIEYNGERLPQTEWARRLGLKGGTGIGTRLKRGWPLERALTEPCNAK